MEEQKIDVSKLMKELEELRKKHEEIIKEDEERRKKEQERKARERFTTEIKQRLKIKGEPEALKEMSIKDLRIFANALKNMNIQIHEPGPLTNFEEKLGKYALPVLLIATTALSGLIIGVFL